MQLFRVIRPRFALELPLVIILLQFCVKIIAYDGSKGAEQFFTVIQFVHICLNPQSPWILKTGDANCIDDAIVRIIYKCYFL